MEWLKRNADNILGNLIANVIWLVLGSVIVIGLILWGNITSLPGPVIFTIALVVIVVGEWGLIGVRHLWSPSETAHKQGLTIEFYPDRPTMIAARGELKKELEGVYVVWASWYSGTHATAEEVFRKTKKPQKLILLNPEGESAQTTARLFRRPLHQFKTDVEATCTKALEAGCDVRLFDGPVTLMVIAEPEARNGKGWVRVEIAVPGDVVRPNIVIYEKTYPELFQEFVAAFKAVFDNYDTIRFVGAGQVSTPTPTPTPDTADSQPQ